MTMQKNRKGWTAVFSAVFAAGLLSQRDLQASVKVGEPAPEFTATDSNGKARSLSEFKGRTVVLEWYNRDCPFVKKHYGSGNMPKIQKEYGSKGVAWLTVLSSAKGKQGHMNGKTVNKVLQKAGATPAAVLLDPKGDVGRLYGAKTTPHMYVIDAAGMLRYNGAIDDNPSSDPADIPASKNYVAAALDSVLAGQDVASPATNPYGCSVKYAN
jgi:hypothetical protein